MKGDASLELALTAVKSTATSLTPRDVIFLAIDGAEDFLGEPFHLAAGKVPLELRVFPQRGGLARRLNGLLDEVLGDGSWQLIARMDADDESLPGRMEIQRAFLMAHPEVDILGTACNEVDEWGHLLQQKSVPLNHEAILQSLPRSNPINHPTVMVRRRVFESGLRYRTDVSRTEDYHLWIDAAARGFRFANLPAPLLNFRRDTSFFDRRGGCRQACADVYVRYRAIRELRLFTPRNLLMLPAAFVLRLLPGRVQHCLYLLMR
jgi:glycosyltransferase involved in cell wall biosynthesis